MNAIWLSTVVRSNPFNLVNVAGGGGGGGGGVTPTLFFLPQKFLVNFSQTQSGGYPL